LAAQLDPTGSRGYQAKNSTATSGRRNRKPMQNATLCRWPVISRSLHSSASRFACGRGKGRARFFCLEPGLVWWPRGHG